jgi:DNA invertase Pin-like site-specific DNA recombinase
VRRPGLQELLSDVADGLVDIVVVHRLDRLSPQSAMTRRNQHKQAIADKKTNWRTSWFFNLVELASIQ